jgi:hypothetical protein
MRRFSTRSIVECEGIVKDSPVSRLLAASMSASGFWLSYRSVVTIEA